MTYPIQYLGAKRVLKNVQYTTAGLLTEFPGATVAKLAMDDLGDSVGITIGTSVMCDFVDGDEQYIITGQTFTFNKECTLKIGIYKVVV